MENLHEFEKQIAQKIKNATELERTLFGLDICKRLAPDYTNFEIKNNWGDSKALNESIKFIETFLNESKNDLDKLDSIISEIDSIIPDTEDFSDWDVSYALNASVSVYELLMYLKDKDFSHILTISALMTDNIDFKIQMNNNDISEEEIDNHPMLTSEFKYQLELIN